METETLLKVALITSLSSLLIGIVAIYISIWFFKNRLLNKFQVKWNDNLFFPILVFGTIVGVGILVSGAVPAISTTLKIATRNANSSFFAEAFKFISLSAFIVLAGVLVINLCSSFIIKSLFDKANLETEIKEGKYAYAIIYSALFVALCLILKEGVSLLSEILIPFEKINF